MNRIMINILYCGEQYTTLTTKVSFFIFFPLVRSVKSQRTSYDFMIKKKEMIVGGKVAQCIPDLLSILTLYYISVNSKLINVKKKSLNNIVFHPKNWKQIN